MRKLFIILGLIFAIIAVLISVLPLSNLAFIPAIIAIICGLIAYLKSKPINASLRTITLVFILGVFAIGISSYKAVFSKTEVGNTKQLEAKEKKSEKEAIKDLDELDIDLED